MARRKTAREKRQAKASLERKQMRQRIFRLERDVDRCLVEMLSGKSEVLRGVHSSALDSLQSARTSLLIAGRRF